MIEELQDFLQKRQRYRPPPRLRATIESLSEKHPTYSSLVRMYNKAMRAAETPKFCASKKPALEGNHIPHRSKVPTFVAKRSQRKLELVSESKNIVRSLKHSRNLNASTSDNHSQQSLKTIDQAMQSDIQDKTPTRSRSGFKYAFRSPLLASASGVGGQSPVRHIKIEVRK